MALPMAIEAQPEGCLALTWQTMSRRERTAINECTYWMLIHPTLMGSLSDVNKYNTSTSTGPDQGELEPQQTVPHREVSPATMHPPCHTCSRSE